MTPHVADILYYWNLTRAEFKVLRHAMNYYMGKLKLADMLHKPSVDQYNTWEDEGGAL